MKSGARFCAALKKAELPEHRLVMLVAALAVVRVVPVSVAEVSAACVSAAQLAAAGIVVEGGVGVRRGEMHLDVGLDLVIGARCAGIEEEAGLLAGEIPLRAA